MYERGQQVVEGMVRMSDFADKEEVVQMAQQLVRRVYGYTRATLGDLPAGLILELVKRKAAEFGMKLDLLAALQILENSYVDF